MTDLALTQDEAEESEAAWIARQRDEELATYLTCEQVAVITGRTPSLIRRLVAEGTLPSVQEPTWRFRRLISPQAVIDHFVNRPYPKNAPPKGVPRPRKP